MTDVLERPTTAVEREPDVAPVVRRERSEISMAGRDALAALMGGAAIIHFVMVPAHLDEWTAEGVAFLVVAWVQVALAIALVRRPSRSLLWLGIVANAAFAGAWAWTRIWGPPFGPNSGVAEDVSFVDITCTAFEIAFVLLALALLARRSANRRPSRAWVAWIVPVVVIGMTTAALAAPSTRGHSHGHEEGAVADGHHHDGAAPKDDKGLSLIMNGAGEGGGHVHNTSVVKLDAATQAKLDAQLAATKPLIEKYPNIAAAEAAGYRRQGPYSPALGTHYAERGFFVNTGPTMSAEALKHPMLIFDGTEPDSKLAGFMYNIINFDTKNPPEGFVGPNDHWHYHTNVCIVVNPDGTTDAPLGADTAASKPLCDKYGGRLMPNVGYMVHVWPVPGYESDQGLFSNLNSKLTCPNGTYYTIPLVQIGNRKNVCKDVNY
jgi:hypothetical protein